MFYLYILDFKAQKNIIDCAADLLYTVYVEIRNTYFYLLCIYSFWGLYALFRLVCMIWQTMD